MNFLKVLSLPCSCCLLSCVCVCSFYFPFFAFFTSLTFELIIYAHIWCVCADLFIDNFLKMMMLMCARDTVNKLEQHRIIVNE